jgi:hypothetical protein
VPKTELPLTARLANFGAGSGQRTLVRFCFDPDAHATWRGRAYAIALDTARAIGARQVVDLGCRDGGELVGAFGESGVETLGADVPYQAEAAAARFPERAWLGLHPTDYAELEGLTRRAEAAGPRLILAIDVLEHLDDPRPLLRTVRRLLEADPRSRAVVGVTNRDARGPDDAVRLPDDEEHYREWAPDEVQGFLEAGGFWVEQRLDVDAGVRPDRSRATILTLGYDRDRYDAVLADRGLPSVELERIVLTTDHHPSDPEARLGAYGEAVSRTDPSERVAFCRVGDLSADGERWSRSDRRWISAGSLLGSWAEPRGAEDVALELVDELVYLYPKLTVVEYQDSLGIGHRIGQAGRAGLFPPTIRTRVRCHGTMVYRELVSRGWIGIRDIETTYRERIAIELADTVCLSSEFLRRLYLDNGYRIDPDRSRAEPYRFPSPDSAPVVDYGDVVEVLVLGEAAWAPTKPPLVEALGEALAEYGGGDEAGVRITHVPDPRTDARDILRAWAGRVVSVIADHRPDAPLLLLEVASTGCPVVVVDVGALRELVPDRLQRDIVCAPDVETVGRALRRVIGLSPERRRAEAQELWRGMAAERGVGESAVLSVESDAVRPEQRVTQAPGRPTATVIVPSYRTPTEYLRDVIEGLNQQSVRPDEVLFVDDASGPPHVEELERVVADRLRLPYRVIRRDVNGGVAAARHSGLAEVRTDIAIVVDADDVPLNDFVRLYRDYFARNLGVCGVSDYVKVFDDGDDWRNQEQSSDIRLPIGGSAVLGQLRHCFGASHAAFDVAALRESGGWQLPDANTAEDRELTLKLLAMNRRLDIVPRYSMLYRQRRASLWGGRDRLALRRPVARSMPAFDLFERLRLFALMQAHRGLERRVGQLERQLQRQRSANRQADKELERLRRSSEKLGPLELKVDGLRARYSKLRTQLDRPEHRVAERIGRGLRGLRSWSARLMHG